MKAAGVVAVSAGVAITVGVIFGGGSSPPSTGYAFSPPAGQPQSAAAFPAAADCVPGVDVSTLGLDSEQVDIARRGIAAANRAGTGTRGAEIIVSVGLVESDLRNLNHGDRDSLGWLQQRPSQGWRNATDPDKGADDFFAWMLEHVPGWETQDQGIVAQKVQRSGFPDRYGQRMGEAKTIVASLTGCDQAAGVGVAPAAAGKAGAVLAWAHTQIGKRYVLGANGPDAWDCSSFSRAAMQQVGVSMPRTAQAQRDWCAAGNCARIPTGQEQPGDLIFWDSYLGPRAVGHVVIVKDPARYKTVDARGTKYGVIEGSYPAGGKGKNIFEVWRPNGLST